MRPVPGTARFDLVTPAHACATGPELRLPEVPANEDLLFSVASATELAGEIPLEFQLNAPLPAQPRNHPVPALDRPENTPLTLRAWEGDLAPPPQVQWLRDGQPLPDARGRDLLLGPLTAAQAGRYSAVLDNGVSRVTNQVADVALDRPLRGDPLAAAVNGATFSFTLTGNPGQRVAVERYADLSAPPLDRHTDWLGEHGLLYEDDGPGTSPWRYYRYGAEALRLEPAGPLTDGRVLWRVRGGRLGRPYVLEASSDGVAWSPYFTNSVRLADTFAFPAPQNLQLRIRE